MKKNNNMKVALISAPWPVYNRPSMQIGALKSYLNNEIPSVEIDSYHFYLNIAESLGFKLYHEISEKTWLAESIYSALLYPQKIDEIRKLFLKLSSGLKLVREIGFDEILKRVEKISNELILKINWDTYIFSGFSICLCQFSSSLYFIKKIKESYPEISIVAGGSVVSGINKKELFHSFPQIDFIINGEGEKPLTSLVKQLILPNKSQISTTPGLFVKNSEAKSHSMFDQINNLDELPMPDFEDYFKTLKNLKQENIFFPTLPAEISRGCWWNKKIPDTNEGGCAFCNLNLQWKGYRTKSEKKVVAEIDELTRKYQSLSVTFMDNVIPEKKSDQIFSELSKLKKDFTFFCEIRASFSKENLRIMKKGGVKNVQVGIEALSTSLLKRINKGTTTIENLEIIKNCEELGINNGSNLITHFPGSNEEEVAETLKNLDYVSCYRPMNTVSFQLGTGSPVMNNRKSYKIKSVSNHPYFKTMFPKNITKSLKFINQTYSGDLTFQKKIWKPVIEKVNKWKKDYEFLHGDPDFTPILSCRDGREFLIIKRRMVNRDNETHRLTGKSREIYLYCNKIRTIDEIDSKFPGIGKTAISSFLSLMKGKKLMFEEDDSYLSLAVSVSLA